MTVPVITPNLGIFWYFFLELFLPFRSFFLLVFQFHILVYIVPILLRFGKELPLFSTGLYLGILATLKSYPTVGDHALWITFIFLYPDTWRYYRYKFITFGLYLAIFLFIPIMYTLWIHFESGNSNFFYGINLLTLLASVLLLSDYATGVLLRSLYREKNNLESNGEEALLLYSATG
ncbi:hypothetical protein HMI56_001977 [Coelomomyces lativittatus]|nr:hypothetical protein HMI56_001977 [Coelomomyces lativittatus]